MESHRDAPRKLGEPSFRGFFRPANNNQHRNQLADKRQALGPQSAQPRAPEHTLACFGGRPFHPSSGPSFPQSKPGLLRTLPNKNNSASAQPRPHELNLRRPPCDQNIPANSHALPGQPQSHRNLLTAPHLNPTLSRVSKAHETESQSSRGEVETRKHVPSSKKEPPKRQLALQTNAEDSEELFFHQDASSVIDPESNSEYEESFATSPHHDEATANLPPGLVKSNNLSRARGFENDPNVLEDSRETTATKRSIASGMSGSRSRKRRFVSPSNCHLAHSPTLNEDATSVNALLNAVGKRNQSLEDELNQAVTENEILRQKIDTTEKERIGSIERLKQLASKISAEKKTLDENFGEMKFQVKERLEMEKKQAESSCKEIGALRIEIRESLEALGNFDAKSDMQDDESLTTNHLSCTNLRNSRKMVDLIKEIDEDRNKKQLVIDMFRKELEIRSGQVTEMSQRILELENLSNQQLINNSQTEKSWENKSRNIQQTVDKRTELILNRLDEKNCFEEENFHARIRDLENQVLTKDQRFFEISKDLVTFQLRLEESQKSLSIELQNNACKKEELLKLSIDFSLVEKKRTVLEILTSKLIKEKVNEQEIQSKIRADNFCLQNENKSLSEDIEIHQNLLTQANRNVDTLNLRLKDQESVIGGLRSCKVINESINVELVESNKKIHQLQEENSTLQAEKVCMHLHVSECHLKLKMLESKKEDIIRISMHDSHAATLFRDENSQLKVQIEVLEKNVSLMKEECFIAQQKISLKQEELVKASGRELQLKEKIGQLLQLTENQENMSKELQARLGCMQSKCEELRGKEDFVTGEVTILRENLAEVKENQISLKHETEKLRGIITDLSVKNSELEMIGESRRSRETIERLSEQLKEEVQKHDAFDKILKERCENEAKITNLCEETKKQAAILENLQRDRDSLLDRLKTTERDLQRSQKEMDALKASHALQLSAAENTLQETEKQASESRKQAISAAREKAIATLEHKYELRLMNADNEKKRLTNKLCDSESRLLAMSAELAKLKGKPSLEEIFSSSEHNEQALMRPMAKKRSETILGFRSCDLIEEPDKCSDEDLNQARVSDRGQHKKPTKLAQEVPRGSKVITSAKKEDQELQVVPPRSSERVSISTTRITKRPGVKKKSTKRST